MKMTQIYSIVNNMATEMLGDSTLVNENLDNIVDIGKEMLDSTDIEKFTKTLLDHIGRVVFVDKYYKGSAPSIVMDSWEFGSVLEKIQADIPVATENKSWDLTDGTVYEQDTFYKPSVSAKFFNERVTFEVPMSFTEKQVKSAFSNVNQLNGFFTMISNNIDKAFTIRMDALVLRTINNMTAQTLHAANPTLAGDVDSPKAINLLYLYNQRTGKSLTAAKCLADADFIRYCAYAINSQKARLKQISTQFNVGGKARFTPEEDVHVVLLGDLVAGSTVYVQADAFHNDLVALPKAEIVNFWQGSGTDYRFDSISKIDVTIDVDGTPTTLSTDGILGVMFDSAACGISCLDRRVTTHYNARAEFMNNFYKMEVGYYNDLNENFIVFYAKDIQA